MIGHLIGQQSQLFVKIHTINEKVVISLLVMLIIARDDLKECFQWEERK